MKRSFTFLLAAFLMLMTNFVWGQTREEVVAYTLDGTETGGSSGYATESAITQDGLTWMVMGNTTMNPWRIGGKSLTNENRPVYSTGTISDNITKIVVTHGTASNVTVNSMTLIVSSNADFSNPTSTMTGDFAASSTTTFTRPSATDWTGKYYKIIYNITITQTSNKFLQFIKAEFYKENGGMESVATPTFSPEAGTYTTTQNVTISCTTSGATIYYTTDGTTPTTSSSVYSSPIAISETTTVKAMAAKSGMTNSSVATATYTITQLTEITTIAGLWEFANTVGTTATQVSVTFNDWYVSGVKSSQAIITDGQYGFVIYQSGHGFTAGDKLNGTVVCNALMYQNHYAELTGVKATDLTVTSGQDVPVLTTTINDLEVRNYGTPINLGTLTYNGTAFVDGSLNTITPYNNFNLSPNPISSLVSDKQYTVKGVYIVYWQSGNPVKQVAPRSADDFEEYIAPTYFDVNVASGIANGTVSVDPTTATEGTTITVTATPNDTYVLETLTYSYESNTFDIDQNTMQFTMPAADVIVNATFSQLPQVATPTFSPEPGYFTSVQNVTIACTTANATIYYTLDGSDPTTTSAVYTESIEVGETTTIKAFAVKDGMLDSEMVTGIYTIEIPTLTFNKLAAHSDVTDEGIYMIVDVNGGYALTSANGTSSAPTAVAVTIENDAITGNIADELQWNFTAVDGGYTINPINDTTKFLYSTSSNNGVRVGTNTNNVWELNITDGANYHGFKNVATSRYIGVYNNQDWRTYTSIHDNIKNTQMEIFVLGEAPVHTYYNVNVAGSIANGSVSVDHTTAEAGTTITVTATPDAGYELTTLTYLYAANSYNINMETMQFTMPAGDVTVNATFTELAHVANPTFSPAAGSYISVQQVSLACATEGATIYYTLDGTEPTTESTEFTEAFTVSSTTTVKAFAVKEGFNNSDVVSAEYVIIEPMTIAAARALAVNEYALVQGIVTFLEGRNVFVQDATGGINLYLNSNTVPTTLALGDMVKGYGKLTNYGGLLELTSINGNDENQFLVLSSGNPLPLEVRTIAEIIEDFNGGNALQATRVKVEDAIIGAINTSGNTIISQGDDSIIIYKIPAVEGLEEGDIVDVTGIIGAFNNVLQLRVANATDVTYIHPAGITVNPATLSGFNYVYEEGPSTVKTFNISARSLTAPTYIYASENYEISSFPGESFYPESVITINTYTGAYDYTIKVRLKAGLEIGEYNEDLIISQEEVGSIVMALSGSVTDEQPQPQGGYTRLSDISLLTSGSKVIFAARYNENVNEYFAMTAQASGKPEGVLFTSVVDNGETLPAEITDVEDTFYWTVDVNGDNYTFTNANGDVLGYTSGTNFATGGDNTAWTITFQTSEEGAMVPNYSGFVVNNVNNAVRAIALNSNHNFGPYHTQNMGGEGYNFFLDIFASVGGGTPVCAAPVFTPEAGTYYEAQTVEITCSTADATIYYTLDGSEPDENSEVYETPITVAESMTIKAIAMKEDYENSNIATAEYTIIIGAVTIFSQDWEGDMNGWTFVTVEGGNAWTVAQYSGNHYAYANGYNGGVNEQWCISPAFSLNVYSNASLSFRNAKNYSGPDMEVYFSNDYDGENPATATWTELEYEMSTGSYTWAESGTIDLANFTGDECYIGFKYISTDTEAAAWEVDDITLMGFTTDPYLTVAPNALSGFSYIVGNGPSAAQTFTVSGGNLPPAPGGTSGGVNISISNSNFELSLDGEVYSNNLSIEVVGTLEPTTVYVRLEAGLPVYEYIGMIFIEDGGTTVSVSVIGNVIEEPQPGGDWNRIYALSDLNDGDQVILASRYDATVGDGYYAMTAGVSGKPDGVLFTSVNNAGVEQLPAEISNDADTYLWNVTLEGDVITLVNAAGDSLGYSSSTNFAGNTNTEWNIALQTSEEGALIPNYTGFVITNGTTTNRGIAKNSNNKFGAYATSNMNNPDYNFYLDLFVYGGSVTPTVATPVFSMASGTYYETIEVEITCATEGATIYYTTDGSDPTEDSEIYEEPIVVESDMTIKAIAMMEGYDNSGIATASYVIMSDVVVIMSQDWEGDMNGWTFVTIEGNKPWTIGTYAGNHYANANGYGDDVNNEQWCISPAFNLNARAYQNVTLTFMNATKFDGPALELYFSNDYDGQDPTAASWEPLEYIPSEGNYTWTESGEISLDEFSGENCYIAFRYISTIEDGAAAWEVDDIMIVAGEGQTTITPDATLDVAVWNRSNELVIENNGDETLNVVVYNLVGQPVLSENVASGSNVIRHNFAEGVYIVRISDGKEMTGIKVVVTR